MTDLFLNAFVTLFVTIDPIGILPIFLGLTAAGSRQYQVRMALVGSLIATLILLLFALAGEWLLEKFGISLPAFRVAGGLLLFLIALEMLFSRRTERRQRNAQIDHDTPEPEDISAFPLGIPLICGPGAIASIMLLTSQHPGNWTAQATVIGAMLTVMALCVGLLLLAIVLHRYISRTLTDIVTRLLGMLLAALAVQYLFDGLREGLLGG